MTRDEFYRLDSFENNRFTPIKIITPEEYKAIKASQEEVLSFNKQFRYFVYFHLNFREYSELKKSLTNIRLAHLDIQVLLSTNFYMKVNQVVFNLLQSFKFFLDGSEAHVKRVLGKEKHQQLKTLQSRYFDNSFAYRFLFKLRNYSQHIAFPIHLLPVEGQESLEYPELMRGDIKLQVDKKILLEEKELFGKVLMKDFENLSDEIDVGPLILELNKVISAMEFSIYKMHHKLDSSIQYLEDFAGYYKTNTNSLVILFNFNDTEKYHRFSQLGLPFDDIKGIKDFLHWAKTDGKTLTNTQ